jgi:hypothetical protein
MQKQSKRKKRRKRRKRKMKRRVALVKAGVMLMVLLASGGLNVPKKVAPTVQVSP